MILQNGLLLPNSVREGSGARLSDFFYEQLKLIDPACDAFFDYRDDAIHVWARRRGMKVHELTVRREAQECRRPLEMRTLKKLRECDVWKNHGSGEKYDDYLHNSEMEARTQKKLDNKRERIAMLKDERKLFKVAIENAQEGRFTKDTAVPRDTGSVSLANTNADKIFTKEKKNGS